MNPTRNVTMVTLIKLNLSELTEFDQRSFLSLGIANHGLYRTLVNGIAIPQVVGGGSRRR